MSVTIGTAADAQKYLEVNKKSWDSRAAIHAASPAYNIDAFKSDPSYISTTLTFDLPRLPSLKDLHVAHLQCHIGTDTLSLVRLGAASATGLDFSNESLHQARLLASATYDSGGARLRYIEGDVYDAVSLLGAAQYDVVFTGIGALGWLPSISRWANLVSELLKPGGKFFIREAHPMLWTIDEAVSETNPIETLSVVFPYFEDGRPIVNSEGLVYTDNEGHQNNNSEPARPPALPTIEFNHGLGEIIQALLEAGLRITMVQEHQSVPWNALPGRMERIEGEEGAGVAEWRMKRVEHRGMVPLSYTLQAVKDL